jgi:hypothetical protein
VSLHKSFFPRDFAIHSDLVFLRRKKKDPNTKHMVQNPMIDNNGIDLNDVPTRRSSCYSRTSRCSPVADDMNGNVKPQREDANKDDRNSHHHKSTNLELS